MSRDVVSGDALDTPVPPVRQWQPFCPRLPYPPAEGTPMLATLILAAQMLMPHTAVSPPPPPAPAKVTHAGHLRHLAHLRHLHLLHAERMHHRTPRSHHPVTTSRYVRTVERPDLSGTLSCRELETLWRDAGGSPASAFLAAEIAMAESGGRQYATGAAGERGYWQVHPDHGPLSTYDPIGNARAAVLISQNGRSWSAWTTFTSGAYRGRC